MTSKHPKGQKFVSCQYCGQVGDLFRMNLFKIRLNIANIIKYNFKIKFFLTLPWPWGDIGIIIIIIIIMIIKQKIF